MSGHPDSRFVPSDGSRPRDEGLPVAPARTRSRLALALTFALLLTLAVPTPAAAHPEACTDKGATSESWWGDGFFATAVEVTNIFSSLFPGSAVAPLQDEDECLTDDQVAALDDTQAAAVPESGASSRNVRLLANVPKSGPFESLTAFNSDIAFWGDYAIQGNYEGVQITDIRDPRAPQIVSQVVCPGSQNDVSVWENLIVTSTDSSRNTAACEGNVPQTAQDPASWEGIRVFDWSDPAAPRLVATVETDCGSHTHTLLPEEDRVLVYVQSYGPRAEFPDCQPPHDKISVVEIPLDDPASAAVVGEPVLFPDGGFPGVPPTPSPDGELPGVPFYTSATSGCHDITVYQALDLAAGACMGEGVIMDISDPVNPVVLSSVTDPNFAFWHSATFSNDGTKVVFTDELLGGGGPTCNPSVGPERGANAIYDISDPTAPEFRSYYKIPRTQSNEENCVAHNGSLIPVPGRDVMVQAWYQGGISIMDFTDAANPRELGWFDRGSLGLDEAGDPILGGAWSSYWYRGKIFSNEIQRGLDVVNFRSLLTLRAQDQPYLNAQTQEPLR